MKLCFMNCEAITCLYNDRALQPREHYTMMIATSTGGFLSFTTKRSKELASCLYNDQVLQTCECYIYTTRASAWHNNRNKKTTIWTN